jgi:hypothetical protein
VVDAATIRIDTLALRLREEALQRDAVPFPSNFVAASARTC